MYKRHPTWPHFKSFAEEKSKSVWSTVRLWCLTFARSMAIKTATQTFGQTTVQDVLDVLHYQIDGN